MENDIKKYFDEVSNESDTLAENKLMEELRKRGYRFNSKFSLYTFLSKNVIKSSGPELDIYYLNSDGAPIELFRICKSMNFEDDGVKIKVTITETIS